MLKLHAIICSAKSCYPAVFLLFLTRSRGRGGQGGRVIMGQLGEPFISSKIIGRFVSCKAQNAKYKDVDKS